MLVNISMENFKSFMEKTEIDLKAKGYEILSEVNKNSKDILKGALIVGGNATGKSNVLKSIKFLLELLVWQINLVPIDYLCLFKESTGSMILKYCFLINGEDISYKIECDKNGISKEELLVGENQRLCRIGNSAEYKDINNKEIKIEKLELNQSAIRKVYFDTKFIDDNTLKTWFEFLERSVYIDITNKVVLKPLGTSSMAISTSEYFKSKGTDKFNKFLDEIGYEQKVEYSQGFDNGKIKFIFGNGQKGIIIKRRNMDFALPINMESQGNQTLITILPFIFQCIENNGMIIIDEFSSSLHNVLEERIIKYFMNKAKESQLFCVSHSTNLLTNSLLRPDQIYTVDFINGKGSKLNRVSESKPREAQNLEKMYLSGVFNGLPSSK